MVCNHNYIPITFNYITFKIIYKPLIRFNTVYMILQNHFNSENIGLIPIQSA